MKLVREPWSASSESVQARSAVLASRRARTRPSAAAAAMNCVPFTSESPSFARSRTGSRPTAASASAPGISRPSTAGLALADERQREVRERREVAARADRPARRDARHNAAVQALEQQLDGLDAGARGALRERVRAQQHGRADDLVRVRRRRRRTRASAGAGAGAPRSAPPGSTC